MELEEDARDALLKKAEMANKRAAKKEQNIAMLMAVINTAEAVTKALPNFVLAGLVGAKGAIEIATIKAQKFARGTKNAPGGWSITGEEGPELQYVPQGSRIYPTEKTMQMLSSPQVNIGDRSIIV